MSGPSPAEKATAAQRRGADPALCAWVSASAGSGKTKLLSDRLLRLLLDGVRPERILCITYTKAGAAEVRARLAETLTKWAIAPDDELRAALKALIGAGGGISDLVGKARMLLAEALDTPGGLRIETIHAFCQSVLRRFPLEAGLPPHFKVIDELTAKALNAGALREAMAAAVDDADLAADLDHVAARVAEFEDLFKAFLLHRPYLVTLRSQYAGRAGLAGALRIALDLPPLGDLLDYLRRESADDKLDAAGLRRAIPALAQGGKRDNEVAQKIGDWLGGDVASRARHFADYHSAFMTKENTIKTERYLGGKAAQKILPDLRDILTREAERLMRVEDKRRAFTIFADSLALAHLGLAIFARYEERKRAEARLDYDDLILRVRDLLRKPDLAPWILYKLDGEADHILIDEAQDTNPAQWDIVRQLTADWVAGAGIEPERRRTLFVVGDYKQSIFSFQGADPEAFRAAHDDYRRRLGDERAANDPRPSFEDIPLAISFRSGPAILAIVDAVLAGPAGEGVLEGDQPLPHEANRLAAASEVELWPTLLPDEEEEGEEEIPSFPLAIREGAGSTRQRLAAAIAHKIRRLIDEEILPARGRPIRAGDILVLVRTRSALVHNLTRELKARMVPVAGLDSQNLLDHIAVRDLVAFLDFLALPEDDLNLATLLKSPLFNLSEESLFTLAVARGAHSLWRELARRAELDSDWAALHRRLVAHRRDAARMTPYECLADLLQAKGGRHALQARLGEDIGEAIDALLDYALLYEQEATPPSLQGFLQWLRAGDIPIKREAGEEAENRVRILTIHGAKGLEAPIVFLIDDKMRDPRDSGLFWAGARNFHLPIWSVDKGADCAAVAALRDAAASRRRHEENRLLYVAMTRAADRLYVCAARGKKQKPSMTWHEAIATAMSDRPGLLRQEPAIWAPDGVGWPGEALLYRHGQSGPAETEESSPAPVTLPEKDLPDWARKPAAPIGDPPRPLMPSRPLLEEPALVPPFAGGDDGIFRRGLLLHKLFQILPDVAPGDRARAAFSFLKENGIAAEAAEPIAGEAIAILDHPDFAPLFAPGSLAEVPIVGRLRNRSGRIFALSGQIDRLIVESDRLLVVDYKTNREPAMQPEQIPPAYLGQLALYKMALEKIYPGRTILCHLLWTRLPSLMIVPDPLIEDWRARQGWVRLDGAEPPS